MKEKSSEATETPDHETAIRDAQRRNAILLDKLVKRASATNPLRQLINECIRNAGTPVKTVELPDYPADRL